MYVCGLCAQLDGATTEGIEWEGGVCWRHFFHFDMAYRLKFKLLLAAKGYGWVD